MIIESIVLGFSSIVVSSLLLANGILKREHELIKEFVDEDNTDNLKEYLNIKVGTTCPMCGCHTTLDRGLRAPSACKNKKCSASRKEHLHVQCNLCESEWMMRSGLAAKDKNEK